MIAYLDSSVMLRLIFREPGGLGLGRVEFLRLVRIDHFERAKSRRVSRTIDRLRLQGSLSTATSVRVCFQVLAKQILAVIVSVGGPHDDVDVLTRWDIGGP